jgi:GTP cyclohydrolase IA
MTIPINDMRVKGITTIAKMPVTEAEMMQAVRTLLLGMSEDPDREGLIDTPKRVVKSLKYLSSGYQQSLTR